VFLSDLPVSKHIKAHFGNRVCVDQYLLHGL